MIIGITQQHAVIWCGIVRFVQFSLPQRWQTLVSPERCNPLSPAALCDVGVVWARFIVAAALGGGGADTESPPPELRRLLSACSACCSMANVSSDRSCKLLTIAQINVKSNCCSTPSIPPMRTLCGSILWKARWEGRNLDQ
jgi:hypothetical protein